MSYYSPKALSVLAFFTALVNSCSFPVLGLIIAQFQYILFKAAYDPNFIYDRDHWIGYWIVASVIIGAFNAMERISIGVAGENLTFNVRCELVRGILYK